VSFETGIAKRLVTFLHCLLETGFGRAALKLITFFCVARDPVKDSTDQLRLIEPLSQQGLIDRQLHHHRESVFSREHQIIAAAETFAIAALRAVKSNARDAAGRFVGQGFLGD
jgi:hypothetical protein